MFTGIQIIIRYYFGTKLIMTITSILGCTLIKKDEDMGVTERVKYGSREKLLVYEIY